MIYLATYRLAPTENTATVEKKGFNEVWAFADNHARHNTVFRLISITEKATGKVVYRG